MFGALDLLLDNAILFSCLDAPTLIFSGLSWFYEINEKVYPFYTALLYFTEVGKIIIS